MKAKNVLYKVTNGWINWRGRKYRSGDEFIATNPDPAEQMMLDKQCTPVETASIRVLSGPVEIETPTADEPTVDETDAEQAEVEKPEAKDAKASEPKAEKAKAGKSKKKDKGE
ncbi:MAG: hypothetical protein P1S60_07085 [Anaerolineae bacterium]|nr:hypothetical protein [Anaerolineae bacterium]